MATTTESKIDSVSGVRKPFIKISDKKLKRLEMKKRKLKSYLELALSEESLCNRKKVKNRGNNIEPPDVKPTRLDSFKALRNQLKNLRSQTESEPEFYLTKEGFCAKIFDGNPAQSAVFLEDIQHLILLACLRIYSPISPRWCRLPRARKLSHVLVVSIEGITSNDFLSSQAQLKNIPRIFPDIIQMIPPSNFQTEFTNFPVTLNYKGSGVSDFSNASVAQPLKSLMPGETLSSKKESLNFFIADAFPRTTLLLSAVQMVYEDYPLPLTCGKDTRQYKWSLPSYKDVSDHSPLFALDCEMCVTEQNQSDLTRISIVDEKYSVLLDTLVKPKSKIIDYVTHYSGITEEMLKDVTTTLEDVQAEIRAILPQDAILCGQSLNFDLHVLKLFHPYVIDTSVIYNLSGTRHRKSSLKHLSSVFLKKDIQTGADGHCSIEDSIATIKLVQLKLQKGLHYGDSMLENNSHLLSKGDTFSSVFPMILSQNKEVCVIGNAESFAAYSDQSLPEQVKRFVQETNEGIVRTVINQAVNHKVTFCHMRAKETEDHVQKLTSVDNSVFDFYKACAINSLIVIMFNGCAERKLNGLCMVKVKGLD